MYIMNYIDLKYINLISARLDRFKKKSASEYNFRCPFCGDSEKSKTKARGWIIESKQESFYYCHNCNISQSMYNLINKLDVSLAKQYYFEKFKSKHEVKKEPVKEFDFQKPVFNTNILSRVATSLSKLSSTHIAIEYVKSRKIPKSEYSKLYYIDEFNKLDNESSIKDERLIIPYHNKERKLVGFTGRALKSSAMRYANVSYTEEQLFYGLNDIDFKKDIYIVEGAIDSMFIDNSIAVNNSNLTRASSIVDKDRCILIPDKEPRNKIIVKNIKRFIEMGYRVCLLPDTVKGKDINEYVSNGIEIPELQKIIDGNIYSGMTASLKLTEWKRT